MSSRICKHLNEDYADSVLLYAQIFGEVPDATSAMSGTKCLEVSSIGAKRLKRPIIQIEDYLG